MAEENHMKMARALPSQIEATRQWFQKLEELMDDEGNGPFEIGSYVLKTFEQNRIDDYERILFGYETLIENACDQSLSYLEFKPEIKLALYQANAEAGEGSEDRLYKTAKALLDYHRAYGSDVFRSQFGSLTVLDEYQRIVSEGEGKPHPWPEK